MKFKNMDVETRNEFVKYLFSFIAVMLIGAALIAAQGENPVIAMAAIIKGSLGSIKAVGNSIRWSIPCIMSGMAAAVAFKSGINNLGIEGQMYCGAIAAGAVGYMLKLPPGIHALVCLGAGALAGLLFAMIPAILRLVLDVNEMVVTLMLNYIAVLGTEYITVLLIGLSAVANPLSVETPPIADGAALPLLIKGTKANFGIFIALAVVVVVAWVYKYTIKGYELKQVGENPHFSKVGGIHVMRTFISIFLISGAIGGLCGAVEVTGSYKKFSAGFAGTLGWDGIMISRIGKNKPAAVLIVSLLWGMLKAGSLQMERITSINRLTVTLIQAIFVLFITVDYQKVFELIKGFMQKLFPVKGGNAL